MFSVACFVFEGFLESGGTPEATLQAMLSVLTQPVQPLALQHAAAMRTSEDDPDLLRDQQKARLGFKSEVRGLD
jgi:hypothetical protein